MSRASTGPPPTSPPDPPAARSAPTPAKPQPPCRSPRLHSDAETSRAPTKTGNARITLHCPLSKIQIENLTASSLNPYWQPSSQPASCNSLHSSLLCRSLGRAAFFGPASSPTAFFGRSLLRRSLRRSSLLGRSLGSDLLRSSFFTGAFFAGALAEPSSPEP